MSSKRERRAAEYAAGQASAAEVAREREAERTIGARGAGAGDKGEGPDGEVDRALLGPGRWGGIGGRERRMRTVEAVCADAACEAGRRVLDLVCAECGEVRYIGPECGHVAQPCAVAASAYGGPLCEACEQLRDRLIALLWPACEEKLRDGMIRDWLMAVIEGGEGATNDE